MPPTATSPPSSASPLSSARTPPRASSPVPRADQQQPQRRPLQFTRSPSPAPAPAPSAPVDYGQLCALCTECYDTFPAQRVTMESHFAHFVAVIHPELAEASHRHTAAFIEEIFFGLERLAPMLALTVNGLYERHGSTLARHDRTLCLVVTLLVIDKLPLLPWPSFRQLVKSQAVHTMFAVLSFFYDSTSQSWLAEQWSTLYDSAYVRHTLLATINTFRPQAQSLLQSLAAQLEHVEARREQVTGLAVVSVKPSTVQAPFKLSHSKPKALPQPLVLVSHYTAKPVPRILERNSLAKLDEERRARQARILQQVVARHANDNPPSLSAYHRPSTLSRALTEASDREAALTEQRSYARPMPAFPTPAHTHKSTAAMILREEEFYRRQREDERERLLRFEQELRDSAAFDDWQAERRKEDDETRKREIERRKQEMAQAAIEAQRAVAALIDAKHQSAQSAKDEAERRRAQLEATEKRALKQREDAARLLAAQVEQAVLDAQRQMTKQRRAQAQTVASEKRELARICAEREAAELLERKALIQRIQAMEKLAAARAKEAKIIERSVGSGLPLLEEMSIAEMRERLRLLEEREAAEIERKRAGIQQDKQLKSTILQTMQARHNRRRRARREVADRGRLEGKTEQAAASARIAASLASEEAEYQVKCAQKRANQIEAALQLAATKVEHARELRARQSQHSEMMDRHSMDMARARLRITHDCELRAAVASNEAAELHRASEANRHSERDRQQEERLQSRQAVDRLLAQRVEESKEMSNELDRVKREQAAEMNARRLVLEEQRHIRNEYAARVSETQRQLAREEAQSRAAAENASRDRAIAQARECHSLTVTKRRVQSPFHERAREHEREEESKESVVESTTAHVLATTLVVATVE